MKLNLPVLILRNTVLFPDIEIKLEFETDIEKNVIYEAEAFHDNKIFIIALEDINQFSDIKNMPKFGVVAKILKRLELPNGKTRIFIKGIIRAHVIDYINTEDYIETIISTYSDINIEKNIESGTIKKLYRELDECIKKVPYMSNSILNLISDNNSLDKVTDIIVNNLQLDNNRLLLYVKEFNPLKRAEMIVEDIYKVEQLFDIENDIDKKVKRELDEDEKNFYLKEKIKLLQDELGEISLKEEEIINLKEKVDNLNADISIKNKILNEIDRYENMPGTSPEISIVRNYINFIISLPWGIYTKEETDLSKIKKRLDDSHYKLDEIKDRIIEYLAVKQESNDINSPIICLVGPPGVGKTTLVSSIANSIGRNFVKISLGGVDDEAIIKGHMRTYIGSTPGRIIDGIRRAKSSNPVFLIDEIDKMSNNYKGDPASALLEVLDSSQNKYFKDNYLEEEYDLSHVLFIATANDISKIPDELKDRLEIIYINGYTELEKLKIAKKYLIPSICKNHGIKNIKISDEEILNIIRFYTKESGLRELDRLLSKIVRKIVANKVIKSESINLDVDNIEKYLGKKIYESDELINEVGVVNALAYTNFGGDILPIESNYYEGSGNIIITGSIGDVMLESAKIALSYIKANAKLFKIDSNIFKSDIHINVPNIAVKKEGPSAGVAITTSIISSLSNLFISNKVAMTGEITLRGNVIKVGGLKEKIIGAYINHIDTIFFPQANIKDLDEVPKEIKDKIKFIPVKKYEEIYMYLTKVLVE